MQNIAEHEHVDVMPRDVTVSIIMRLYVRYLDLCHNNA